VPTWETRTIIRPAWRGYWHYWLISWLIFPFLILVWKRFSVRLVITGSSVTLEEGILTTRSVEIPLKSVRAVLVMQSLVQKLLGVGDILVGASATGNFEIVAKGFPDPRAIRLEIEERNIDPMIRK